ncbi:hypothetical protein [Sphingopyxis sp. LK2115]|jgi:predicted flap endonuclease-1-like 5' DNA nuclease|uniref:hypothetical protein n=1 Tax=Sphingopyxis sp. LK2115 TaxID=2744558 RepID=UPI001660C288|nr:hypothetical protein [Sphingopyxis sp. LK2115]
MIWLQDNWVIAVVGLVVAALLLWWLFGRAKPTEIAPPTAEPSKPAKPLEPAKPEIIAAEPARFKPVEPKPAPVAPAPPPAAGPAATPPPAPVAEPVAETPTKPKQAAKKTATKTPAAKGTSKKVAAKPPADAAAIPAEPTVPPPAPEPAPTAVKADNLQLLKGVGPKLVVLLNSLGVTRFQQIAEWTDADVARIDAQLGAFQGRIARDNLVDQASYLARGDKAGFEAKYGALGGDL